MREQYKKFSREEKIKVISMILAGKSLRNVEKETGVAKSTIREWISNTDINPDKEYALKYRQEHPWMDKRMRNTFNKKDPFTEEIPETTTNDPKELKKENRDLRKKIAYLEDKITYLQTLYEIISTNPSEVSKKKDFKQS